MTTLDHPAAPESRAAIDRLWKRDLDRYPDTGPRVWYLAVVVLATIVLYCEQYVTGGVAPYFFDISPHAKAVDPVVQALALTDVVVEAAVTALLLSFAVQAHKRFGTLDPHELAEFKG